MGMISQHEKLRLEVKRRIDAGDYTATQIAKNIRYSQPAISQFLNKKKGISNKKFEALVEFLGIDPVSLLDAPPQRRAAAGDLVPVVSHSVAMSKPYIAPGNINRYSGTTIASLISIRAPRVHPTRRQWVRFVAIDVTPEEADLMQPILSEGATIIIDRHFQDFARTRYDPLHIYAVVSSQRIELGYPDLREGVLSLYSHIPEIPPRTVIHPAHQRVPQMVVGRVCSITLVGAVKQSTPGPDQQPT